MSRAVLAVCLAASSAHADDAIPHHTVDAQTDRVVILGALAAAVSPMTIPIRHALWDRELFGDADTREHFSRAASQISDATLGASIAAPFVYLSRVPVDDATGD